VYIVHPVDPARTPIFDHKALRLELLDGHFRVLGEEKHIPILVTHPARPPAFPSCYVIK
jgi:hypothetical protein